MSTTTRHVTVWIDHHEARVFHIEAGTYDATTIEAPTLHRMLHPKGGKSEGKRIPEDQGFYHEVAEALGDAVEVLVVGPAKAKLEFIKHLHRHDPALAERVIGVETVDHPTDGSLARFSREYFRQHDPLLGRRPTT